MIEYLLDTYETIMNKKDPTIARFKRMDIVEKIVIAIIFIGAIWVIVSAVFISSKIALTCSTVYILFLYLSTAFINKSRRKKWDANISHYNEYLDEIKTILQMEQFNMYSKNMIKQVIFKFKNSIVDAEEKNNKTTEYLSKFWGVYVLPLVAFICGQVAKDFNTNDLIMWGICAIVFVFCIRVIIFTLTSFITMLYGNRLENKRYFIEKLQDLLDRDFEVCENDLLKP